MAPFFVSSDAVDAVFAWREAIDAMAAAYRELAPASALPPRTVAGDSGAWLRTLPAVPAAGGYFGAKLMGMATKAAEPAVEYVVVLYDRERSAIAGFVDGHRITAYRTAATSAAAVDRLAAPGPLRLGVLGSGLEASTHVRALAAVRPLAGLRVFSPTSERREALAAAAGEELGIPASATADPRDAVADADLVLAAARSRGERPILQGDWLADRTTVVSIGSTVPAQREIDASVVDVCDLIVCDAVEEVVHETGDMLEAARAGVAFSDRTFSLHELLAGTLDARLAGTRRPLFKSVGSGVQDVVVAGLMLDKAIAAGLATPLPIAFEPKR